jgi:hypothetical protein
MRWATKAVERDEEHERDALGAAQRVRAHDHEMQREHREPGENVGEQDAGKPRQGGRRRERDDEGKQGPGTPAEAIGAQRQREHPHGGGSLQHDLWPEVERPARHRE